MGSLTKAELLDNCTISFDILLGKVAEQILSVTDHLEQTALRMIILRILLHVLGELVDAGSQNGNLHFGRAGVVFAGLVVGNDPGFQLFVHLFHLSAAVPLSDSRITVCGG